MSYTVQCEAWQREIHWANSRSYISPFLAIMKPCILLQLCMHCTHCTLQAVLKLVQQHDVGYKDDIIKAVMKQIVAGPTPLSPARITDRHLIVEGLWQHCRSATIFISLSMLLYVHKDWLHINIKKCMCSASYRGWGLGSLGSPSPSPPPPELKFPLSRTKPFQALLSSAICSPTPRASCPLPCHIKNHDSVWKAAVTAYYAHTCIWHCMALCLV